MTAIATLASGCVVWTGRTVEQLDTIGDVQVTVTACASNSPGCPEIGNGPPNPGSVQILIGVLLPSTRVGLPSAFTSSGPEALAFSESPSYTAELQRLSPAPPGLRWAGYISAVTNYTAEGPQAFSAPLHLKLGQDAAGGPFAGPLAADLLSGGREVTPTSPGTRPVSCGPSLFTVFDDDPGGPASSVICADDAIDFELQTRDLGILSGGATGAGEAGSLVSVPFTLRYAGSTAGPGVIYGLEARSTLTGARLAVTPPSLTPATDSTSQAVVAVGIPAGARPGTYDVTLTAGLDTGQTRTGVGRLTVLGAGADGGGRGGGARGGPAARLRLTTILPSRLSATLARRTGIVVILGATKPALARVQLFQGPGRTAKATKRVRLRVPGPTRLVLRNSRLRAGAYRIVVTADGRRLVRRAVLTR